LDKVNTTWILFNLK